MKMRMTVIPPKAKERLLAGHNRKACPMAGEVEKFKKGRSGASASMAGDDHVFGVAVKDIVDQVDSW
ncbi:hypothetical protein RIF29_25930 [Crotalaria pallida]|uniref:Uncharacterized protein n=1 Tax=Crotalaria pallida TaxID=3830 RepID=A0AAN9EPD7_CROPI